MDSFDTAVLVGCGNSKRTEPAPPWKLYDSPYFERKMEAAMALGHPYIVSAKYGLVPITDRIEPYDASWATQDSETVAESARQVVVDLPDYFDVVVILAGRDYADPLRTAFDTVLSDDRIPLLVDLFEPTCGIGDQMRLCRQLATDRSFRGRLSQCVRNATRPDTDHLVDVSWIRGDIDESTGGGDS